MSRFPHVFEPEVKTLFSDDYAMKGAWNRHFFKNDHPITVELGCGKGEYTVELARRFPDRNFIGVDIKGNRMWKGATRSLQLDLHNVAFLRTRVEFIGKIFGSGEVDEIWLTFSDPQPKKPRKRLTSSIFLNTYKQFIRSGGTIHLKTDSILLHRYTLALLAENGITPDESTEDLYQWDKINDLLSITTFYEEGFLKQGKPITYLCFPLHGTHHFVEPGNFEK